jgi:hypothetical protein
MRAQNTAITTSVPTFPSLTSFAQKRKPCTNFAIMSHDVAIHTALIFLEDSFRLSNVCRTPKVFCSYEVMLNTLTVAINISVWSRRVDVSALRGEVRAQEWEKVRKRYVMLVLRN